MTLEFKRIENYFANTIRTESGCMEWQGYLDERGYGIVWQKDTKKYRRVTRIVLELLGTDMSNPKLYACHKCDNPKCVNPDHLFAGTSSDNQKDHYAKVRAGTRKHWRINRHPERVTG